MACEKSEGVGQDKIMLSLAILRQGKGLWQLCMGKAQEAAVCLFFQSGHQSVKKSCYFMRRKKRDHFDVVRLLWRCWHTATAENTSLLCYLRVKHLWQGQKHMERYLLEEWQQVEKELLRERSLWGPVAGSRLQRWMLDMTEGRFKWSRVKVSHIKTDI